METVICQHCFVENSSKNNFCQNCDYPLGRSGKRKTKSLIGLLLFFLILFLTSAGALVYVDYQYPNYGLKNRLAFVKEILFHKDWLEQYSNLDKLNKDLQKKKKELDLLAKDLQAKKSILDPDANEKDKAIQEQLNRLEQLESKLKILEGE